MIADIPFPARILARLVPAADRESILGDLVEDAAFRSLNGFPRSIWIAGECAAIGAGFSVTRLRAALVVPRAHELVLGLAVDGRRALRGQHFVTASVRALVFCGSVATLSLAAAVLVSALLSAAGL
jgi:hypothetical protein